MIRICYTAKDKHDTNPTIEVKGSRPELMEAFARIMHNLEAVCNLDHERFLIALPVLYELAMMGLNSFTKYDLSKMQDLKGGEE